MDQDGIELACIFCIIVGGLIGILIVDPATGAMWTLPDSVSLNFVGSSGSW